MFIKLTDAKGQQIKGEAVMKGFEKWIGATTITSGGKNNTQLSFTMAVNGASADLKKAMANGELLVSGQVLFCRLLKQVVALHYHTALKWKKSRYLPALKRWGAIA